ncbi:hypothetical protein FG386_002372 [Cryptosporidium ryanae]|uniref:uncharacterized protein n=1 Tax=Cryptosporidium ryanae TaxID=515981 RepID=UPI00351A7B06|nr:hypothetical protein FG386_002372 [Cryptosporidium ryanae]
MSSYEANSSNKRPIQRMMVQPINQIFRLFTSKLKVQVWLFDHKELKLEGIIQGFDEYMNIVLDQACEIYMKNGVKKVNNKVTEKNKLTLRNRNGLFGKKNVNNEANK